MVSVFVQHTQIVFSEANAEVIRNSLRLSLCERREEGGGGLVGVESH